jgi:hypothetical protein
MYMYKNSYVEILFHSALPSHLILKLKQFQCLFILLTTTQCCSICDHDIESKLAATWSPECEDLLCTDCDRYHARSSSSKKHIVISMENYQKLSIYIHKLLEVLMYIYKDSYHEILFHSALPTHLILKLKQFQCLFILL